MTGKRDPQRNDRGLTLIEMTMSLIVISVVLMACGSVIRLATQSTVTVSDRLSAQLSAADAAARIADDLNVAKAFTARSAKSVTFTVPDRLGTGSPQSVTYAWSGTAGDPLTRSFNGATPSTLLAGVQGLTFNFATRLIAATVPPTEQAMFSHTALLGSNKDFNVTNKNYAAQQFYPSLPLGASSYTLTRVNVPLKVGSQDSTLTVTVYAADLSGRPYGTPLGQAKVYAASLSTGYESIDVPFAGLSGLSPMQPLCVVFGYGDGSTSVCAVQYDQALLTVLSSATWLTSTDSGASWSASASACAKMTVYATVP